MYVHYGIRVMRHGKKGEYLTTIHAVNSGIVKLSKHAKPTTVFRGVSRGMLPQAFFDADDKGAVGGIELSFMSCTTERSIAQAHDGCRPTEGEDEGKALRPAMLFQIKMGMGDRGADVEFLSQFPAEHEVLFAPRTGLEVASKPWVEGSTIMIELRLVCTSDNLTLDNVNGKMKRLHLDMLSMMVGDLELCGAPPRALLALTGLRHESAARAAADFNLASNFTQCTERAFTAQKDVVHALGEPNSWAGDSDATEVVTAQMMRTVLLQARVGQDEDAIRLLLQALERAPPNPQLEAKIKAAERTVAEKLDGSRTTADKARLPDEQRTPLKAALVLLSEGATPPWPAMMTTLLSSLSERAIQVFGAMISAVDPGRARPIFATGAPVTVWSEQRHRWESGMVRAARGRGLFEVETATVGAVILPAKHVLRVAEGGAGALLYEAARRGSPQLVDALLKGGVSVFEADVHANTPLHFAVRRGNAAICKRLLDASADAEVQNTHGITAWDLALQCGHAAVRRIFSPSAADRDLAKPVGGRGASPLLVAASTGELAALRSCLAEIATNKEKGGPKKIDAVWNAGQTTPLMLASRRGDLDAVRSLLRAGADVALSSKRMATALSMAAEEGRTDVVHALLEAGAEVDLADDDGFNPLGIACENGHVDSARALLQASSDPNLARANGWTHLVTAAYNGYTSVVRVLVEGGASPDLAKANGYNAVIAAAYNGFDEMVATLLELGATADAPMSNGWNALMVASAQGHPRVVARLCEANADSDYCRPSNHFSALMAAVSAPHGATCANILLQHGATVDLQDKHGCTALMHAAYHGHSEAVQVLLQSLASVNAARTGGTTALIDAAAGGHEAAIQLLVDAKADADVADGYGFTALMHAAKAGHDAAMLPLLRATRAINRKDKSGQSALDHAASPAAIARLLQVGAEQSREFRRRMHEADGGAKGAAKSKAGSPALAKAASTGSPQAKGSTPQPPTSGNQSARGKTPTSARSGKVASSPDLARLVVPRMQRSKTVGSGLTKFDPTTAIEEAVVKKEEAARLIQQRFKARHNTGNRPEAKLFAMLKQTRETVPDHLEGVR